MLKLECLKLVLHSLTSLAKVTKSHSGGLNELYMDSEPHVADFGLKV